ncbi:MAG: class I SAM-dependent methyltransferase [Bacteroidota bacterium]
MKKWVLKAIVQKSISYLPKSQQINYFFQKHITKGVYLTDDYFLSRLDHAKTHINSYKKFSNKEYPTTSLEIGTGWYPIVPISLFLIGTEKINSVDISFLTSKEKIIFTIEKFIDFENKSILRKYFKVLPERLDAIKSIYSNRNKLSLEDILSELKITYLIEDARKLSLESNSIDLVNSNNTFEHIYPEILTPIIKEFHRVVNKENGVMSHLIDMSDHFAHNDSSISIYNFLKFSDKQWKCIDNSIQPQNRLRYFDFENIYSELNIPITEYWKEFGSPEIIKSMILPEKYKNISFENLAISHCHIVSEMKLAKK